MFVIQQKMFVSSQPCLYAVLKHVLASFSFKLESAAVCRSLKISVSVFRFL